MKIVHCEGFRLVFHLNSGVLQGSALGCVVSDAHKRFATGLTYADELKLWQIIRVPDDRKQLQKDPDALACWSRKWQLPVTYEKCAHIQVNP